MYIKGVGEGFFRAIDKGRTSVAFRNMGVVFLPRITWKESQRLVETSNSHKEIKKKKGIYQPEKAVLSKEAARNLKILSLCFLIGFRGYVHCPWGAAQLF